MSLRILIVDDEAAAGKYLRRVVEQIPGVKVVAVLTSGWEALELLPALRPRLVFLDIDMPGINGLETARAMAKIDPDLYFVFATAYPDYALQAFEMYSFDYILKPFDEARIKKTVTKLIERSNTPPPRHRGETLVLENEGEHYFIQPEDIIYAESWKRKLRLRTTRGDFVTTGDLTSLGQRLQSFGFFRSHRCYLVNIRQVNKVISTGYTYEIILKSGERVLLSRHQARALRQMLPKIPV